MWVLFRYCEFVDSASGGFGSGVVRWSPFVLSYVVRNNVERKVKATRIDQLLD